MPEAKKARYDDACQPPSDAHFEAVLQEFTEVQQKLQELTAEMSEEGLNVVHRVCQEYNARRAPHYASRGEVLNKLPKFWSRVFLNHPLVSSVLTTDDAEVLQHLQEVAVKEYEDRHCGFSIEFYFEENTFFEEKQLEKHITFDEDGKMVVNGTAPTWKEHMDPGGNDVQEGAKRKAERSYNFFLWFDEAGTMEQGLQDEMSFLIKDDIWQNPMQYYTLQDAGQKQDPEPKDAPSEMDVVHEEEEELKPSCECSSSMDADVSKMDNSTPKREQDEEVDIDAEWDA